MSLWYLALQCMYFILPAAFANMAPVVFKNSLKFLAIPIDRGKMVGGKPMFGFHKTVRGFVVGIGMAVLVALLQAWLYKYPATQQLSIVDFSAGYGFAALVGFLMGFGALFGDLVKSFVKRRLDIGPGKPFIPFDEIDFSVGALVFSSLAIDITWQVAFVSVALSLVFHIIINHTAFYLGIRQEKW